jgi:rod shape-determining protein MreC
MVETRSGRRFALFFFIAAFLVLLLGHWLRPVGNVALSTAAPFESAISGIANRIGDGISAVVEGPRLRSENIELKRKLAVAIRRNLTLQDEQHENQILSAMTGFHERNNHMDLLPARVIGNDPNNLCACIIINKGTRDGLRKGLTVLDQNGYFVGFINDVTGNAAKVLLMLSPSSSVGALDLKTQATGLVEGQFTGRPQLQYVRTRASLHVGDFVVTSGQYNLFPRLLLLGQIVRVHHSDVHLFQTADIQPAATFGDLEIVQIVRNWVPSVPAKLLNEP